MPVVRRDSIYIPRPWSAWGWGQSERSESESRWRRVSPAGCSHSSGPCRACAGSPLGEKLQTTGELGERIHSTEWLRSAHWEEFFNKVIYYSQHHLIPDFLAHYHNSFRLCRVLAASTSLWLTGADGLLLNCGCAKTFNFKLILHFINSLANANYSVEEKRCFCV